MNADMTCLLSTVNTGAFRHSSQPQIKSTILSKLLNETKKRSDVT